jgi:redox-sensitive bicupin YhaK (pirin superfamily)
LTHGETDTIDIVLRARHRDIGGLSVRRVLPSAERRLVGPFIFWDEMGPVVLPPGAGVDVRPHPHIHLATLTYLFDGEIVHRDSLGSHQPIRPGAVNWMTAGRGIVHSERTSDEARRNGSRLHGIQSWVALPTAHEESDPSFAHHAPEAIPVVLAAGAALRVIAGSAYGATSPVRVSSPTFFVDATLDDGAAITLPDDHAERAVYVVDGAISCDGQRFGPGDMVVARASAAFVARALEASRLVLLGGAPLDGPRHLWWNFVSSSQERIERAKRDWAEGRFAKIPDDHEDFIPLPVG